MSISYKLFEVKTKETSKILFQAYVKDFKTYRITVDLTGRFKKKFLKIMMGDYSHKYIINESEATGTYKIEGNDPIENLIKYTQDCETFTHTKSTLVESGISRQFALHFKGSDYNMDKGMSPNAAKRASDFFYAIGKSMLTPIASNNADYKKAEEFSIYEAASIKMEMYSSVNFSVFKEVFQTFLNDIHSGRLSNSDILGNKYPLYKKLFRIFLEQAKFKNLDKLIIEIDGQDSSTLTVKDLDAIKDLSADNFGQEKRGTFVIQSVHDYYRHSTKDGLVVDTRNFSQITTWKYTSSEVLSPFLHNQKGESVKLIGISDSETIRLLQSIEFERENFKFTEDELTSLRDGGYTIIDKKIILPE